MMYSMVTIVYLKVAKIVNLSSMGDKDTIQFITTALQ